MFNIKNTEGKSRAGKLKNGDRTVNTPFFMPVATQGTVKYLDWRDINETGAEGVIINAFHSFLKPGQELIKKSKGLHNFINYGGFIFTDSGGFQMLNKDFFIDINNSGIIFRSPYDGKKHLMTPEKVVSLQETLGSDVAMVLDDVPHYGKSRDHVMISMKRTHEWAERAIAAKKKKGQLLFGICQGGTFKDLRKTSTKVINSLDFDGVALGGLCIGESKKEMFEMIKVSVPLIDEEKTRYLMGVGSPKDILEAISQGIDVFDSAFPTMNARHGNLFTSNGGINIEKKEFRDDFRPIDKECECNACNNFSRAYIHHLFRAKEATAFRLSSIHNLYFIQNLVKESRNAIKNREFEKFKKCFIAGYKDKKR